MSEVAHGSLWVTLWTWLQIALALGGIILVHEWGHYVTARWSKMQVDEFAIGVGPTLYEWRRQGTHFRLAPLLFMGYVRIRGLEGEEHPDGLTNGFYSRPHGQRILAMVGGAAANLLAAAAIFCLLYSIVGMPDVRHDTTISDVTAGSAAQEAGIQRGWRIAAINDQLTPATDDVERWVRASHGEPLTLRLVKDKDAREVTVAPRYQGDRRRWLMGVVFRDDGAAEPVVAKVRPGGPAALAGLLPGDRIVQVNGKLVMHPDTIIEGVMRVPPRYEYGEPRTTKLPAVRLTVLRDQRTHDLNLRPRPKKALREKPLPPGVKVSPNADREVESYLVGDAGFLLERRYKHLGVVGAVRTGFASSATVVVGVAENLLMLLQGRGLNQVGGPILIVRSLGDAANAGWYDLLRWAANLSIMIGVFNLLPLPALDGGRVVFVMLDWLYQRFGSRRELNRHLESWIHAVGLMVLLLLMVMVSLRDLAR
jgi:regulator of sigma E protease